MKTMILASVALAAAICSTSAMAAQDSGFYFGLGAGASRYADSVPGQIRAAYAIDPTYDVRTATTTDDTDNAYKAFVGYRALPWLSVEATYADLGQAKTFYRLFSQIPSTEGNALVNGRYRLRAFEFAALGEYPFTDRLTGSLRLGLASIRMEYDETGTFNRQPSSFHAPTQDTTRPLAGLGLAWSFNRHWDARLDVERYFGVGTRVALTEHANGRFDHVDTLMLNLLYRL